MCLCLSVYVCEGYKLKIWRFFKVLSANLPMKGGGGAWPAGWPTPLAHLRDRQGNSVLIGISFGKLLSV